MKAAKRIFLRPLEISDHLLINRWRNDPEIVRYLAGNAFLVSLERERQWVEEKIAENQNNLYFAICLIKDSRLIGYSSINHIDLRNQKAEWGGTLVGDRSFIGKGFGREASSMMLRYLFDQYPIHRCYAYCLQEHPSTEKLFLSLGFKKEGVLRDDVFKDGSFKSLLLFSILRQEIKDHF